MSSQAQFLPGFVRTVVPLAVGYLLNLGAVRALDITETQLTTALTLVAAGAYWLLVRAFEVYVSPKFGRFLGSKAAPVYVPAAEAEQLVAPLPKG
jgi:hypothetical protein